MRIWGDCGKYTLHALFECFIRMRFTEYICNINQLYNYRLKKNESHDIRRKRFLMFIPLDLLPGIYL